MSDSRHAPMRHAPVCHAPMSDSRRARTVTGRGHGAYRRDDWSTAGDVGEDIGMSGRGVCEWGVAGRGLADSGTAADDRGGDGFRAGQGGGGSRTCKHNVLSW